MSAAENDLLVLHELELLLDQPATWWRRAADAALRLLGALGSAAAWLAPADAVVQDATTLPPPGELVRTCPRRGNRGEDTYGLLMPPGLW